VDQTSSSIGGDLPDVSTVPLGEVLGSKDTALARSIARIRREMAGGTELIAAGFNSVISPTGDEDEPHGVSPAVRAQGGESL
jgi:FXSXX-COOH protein